MRQSGRLALPGWSGALRRRPLSFFCVSGLSKSSLTSHAVAGCSQMPCNARCTEGCASQPTHALQCRRRGTPNSVHRANVNPFGRCVTTGLPEGDFALGGFCIGLGIARDSKMGQSRTSALPDGGRTALAGRRDAWE